MTSRSDRAAYERYVYPEPKVNWTDRQQLAKKLTCVDLTDIPRLKKGGCPVISDGKRAYIDTSDNHFIAFGASGFKKSLTLFAPTIDILASAGENMVISDPKGELYALTANYLRAQDYKIFVLNFRDFDADGFNPLLYPAKLYRDGHKDKAVSMFGTLLEAFAKSQEQGVNNDIFWPTCAKAFCSGLGEMMFDSYRDLRDINILSMSTYFVEKNVEKCKILLDNLSVFNAAVSNMQTVLSQPDKTRMSSIATAASFFHPFTKSDKLLSMLSESTFDLETLAEPKTALFIITDDSSTVCDPIVSILLAQLQSVLIDIAFHSDGGKLPTRVNFVLDEFASFPIPDMHKALATHRSRNIRYFLCVQSLAALEQKYPNWQTITTNCATTMFLGSTELKLLDYISTCCGETTKNRSGTLQPLISIAQLMDLKKSWYEKEAVYLNLADGVRYCTTLPAIEKYESFYKYGKRTSLPKYPHPDASAYSIDNLIADIDGGRTSLPFTKNSSRGRF